MIDLLAADSLLAAAARELAEAQRLALEAEAFRRAGDRVGASIRMLAHGQALLRAMQLRDQAMTAREALHAFTGPIH